MLFSLYDGHGRSGNYVKSMYKSPFSDEQIAVSQNLLEILQSKPKSDANDKSFLFCFLLNQPIEIVVACIRIVGFFHPPRTSSPAERNPFLVPSATWKDQECLYDFGCLAGNSI